MVFPPWWLRVAVKVVIGGSVVIGLLALVFSMTLGPIVLGAHYAWHGDVTLGVFLAVIGGCICICFLRRS